MEMEDESDSRDLDPANKKLIGVLSFSQGVAPLVIAVVVLYIFWVLVKQMLGRTDVPELQWSRSTYLFAGVEAIAYAAAGFLFGREVHRQQAQQAEHRADSAQKRASVAEEKAALQTANGQALKRVIEAKMAHRTSLHPAMKVIETFEASAATPADQSDLSELSRIANELFPSA